MIKNKGSILLIILFAVAATAAGFGGSVVYVKNEDSIKNFVGGIFGSGTGAEDSEQSQTAEKDCGTFGLGDKASFNSCVRESFVSCAPAVFRLTGGDPIYRIAGAEGDNCILHNSDGPLRCSIPTSMISSMASLPSSNATDMSSGEIFTDSLIYMFGREVKRGRGANSALPGSENYECVIGDNNSSNIILPGGGDEKKGNTSDPASQLLGGENCGFYDVKKNTNSISHPALACLGKAMANCFKAKMTMGSADLKSFDFFVEGKSGSNCVVSDTGGLSGTIERGGIRCSFPALAGPAMVTAVEEFYARLGQSAAITDEVKYSLIWAKMAPAFLFEGVNNITIPGFTATSQVYNATCALK